MKGRLLILYLVVFSCGVHGQVKDVRKIMAEDSFTFAADTSYKLDSMAIDSAYRQMRLPNKTYALLDSISNDTLLRNRLMPYRQITNFYSQQPRMRLNLPTIKEIETRDDRNGSWKFWIICFILFYISFVRISNQNNFRVFILSVFNLKLSSKIWDEQRSIFSFVILQLFAIYLFIAGLFINYFFELKSIDVFHNYFTQYFVVVGVLIILYACKFIIHGILGVILKMNRLGIGFVANTVSVNNFLSLVIFPFIIFIVYNENPLFTAILTQTVIAIFFVSVLYRMLRIAILSHSFFSFPKVYLFIYLCALEVAPWFVIIKFINHYQI